MRTPKALTVHQRRKCLSNRSTFFSCGAKDAETGLAHSYVMMWGENLGVEETGNYLSQCLWRAKAKLLKINRRQNSFCLLCLTSVLFLNTFVTLVGGSESHWTCRGARLARAVGNTCDVYLWICGKLWQDSHLSSAWERFGAGSNNEEELDQNIKMTLIAVSCWGLATLF